MRLVFFNWAFSDHGSAQDIFNYAGVAREHGHEVVLYGRDDGRSPFPYSLDVRPSDAAIFIFEYSTYLERLDVVRIVGRVPRERRVVIDCDGGYNDAIAVEGDLNHCDVAAAARWREVCESLADKIVQPTLHPLRPNVGTFFFHAYNPAWEAPLDPDGKRYGMCYVGNNWYRWRALRRVLEALRCVRAAVGRIALVGHGWGSPPPWASPTLIDDAYHSDPEYLRRLGVEVLPAVPFDRVIECMGKGVFMPVIYRPLFDRLRLVTCRTFETPAANTIPLFCQDAAFVAEVYGEPALELVLPDQAPEEKVADLFDRREHYAHLVAGIRRRLASEYSYERQLGQLIEIVEA
jgi:glycosyltransferase involved in cell wall biosynthesis